VQEISRRSRQWATTIEVAGIVRAGLPKLADPYPIVKIASSTQA
jgi:hypothetical protein